MDEIVKLINNQMNDVKSDYFCLLGGCKRVLELSNCILMEHSKSLKKNDLKSLKSLNRELNEFYNALSKMVD